MSKKWFGIALVAVLGGNAGGEEFVLADGGSRSGFHIERGEFVHTPSEAVSDRVGTVVVHRLYAPVAGTWDQTKFSFDSALQLKGENPTITLMVNISGGFQSRIRQLQLLVVGEGNRNYTPLESTYYIDGVEQPKGAYIDFDSDPATWQELTLDLSSGPGFSSADRVVRMAIQFTDYANYYFDGIRFSVEDDAEILQADPERKGSHDSRWMWVTDDTLRMMVQCQPFPGESQHRPAWATLDFLGWESKGLIASPGWSPDTVRLIEYDSETGNPVVQRSGGGVQSLLVPCKVERWPRLSAPYDPKVARRPLQVSWLRRTEGPKRPVYGIYFDALGCGEQTTIPAPAFVGTGDVLAYGVSGSRSVARGMPVPIDWNGDGLKDLLGAVGTLPDRGTYLMLNQGSPGHESLTNPFYIGKSVIHGAPQVADINRDGRLDIGVRGGYFSDVANNKLVKWKWVPSDRSRIMDALPQHRTENWRYADWDGDGVVDLVVGIGLWDQYGDHRFVHAYNADGQWTAGPLRAEFYFFKNIASGTEFKFAPPVRLMTTAGESVSVYGNPTPLLVDLDRDGDLDLVSGDFLNGLVVFENVGSPTRPELLPPVPIQTSAGPYRAVRQANTPVDTDWNDDGFIDLLVRNEAGQITLLQNTAATDSGMPVFLPERDILCANDRLNVGQLPANDLCDWDGDGDLDLIFGDSSGFIGWYENIGSAGEMQFAPQRLFRTKDGAPIRIVAGPNGSIQGPSEALWGYTVPDAGDWDLDGRPDIVFNSVWGIVQWCRRPAGEADPSILEAPQDIRVEWPGAVPRPEWNWWVPKSKQFVTQWRSTVRMIDWNRDGLPDIVAMDTEGYLVLHERFRDNGVLKLGPGQRIFLNQDGDPLRINTERFGNSGRMKFDLADWDGDGDRDYIQVTGTFEEKNNVWLFENTGSDESPCFVKKGDVVDVVLRNHTCAPSVFDYDGDGRTDLLIGAEDGHFYAFSRFYIDHKAQLEARVVSR